MAQDTAPTRPDVPTLTVAVTDAVHDAALARLDAVDEQARQYITEAVAANTRRAYRSDWAIFTA